MKKCTRGRASVGLCGRRVVAYSSGTEGRETGALHLDDKLPVDVVLLLLSPAIGD